jgi:hypothetical protein
MNNRAAFVVVAVSLAAAACRAEDPPPQTAAQPPAPTYAPAAPAPPPAPAQPPVDPDRTPTHVRALVMAHRIATRACYDRGLVDHPGVEGTLAIRFSINARGAVSHWELDPNRSRITEPTIVACVGEVISRIHFGPSLSGTPLTVSYPFNFLPRRPSPAAPGAGAPTCFDATASSTDDCAALGAGTSCAASSQTRCTSYRRYLEPKIASAAYACIHALPQAQACDTAAADQCAKAALGRACADSEVTDLCDIAATPCQTTPQACSALLSGLSDDGKERAARCVGRGCTGGLDACIAELASPPEHDETTAPAPSARP